MEGVLGFRFVCWIFVVFEQSFGVFCVLLSCLFLLRVVLEIFVCVVWSFVAFCCCYRFFVLDLF